MSLMINITHKYPSYNERAINERTLLEFKEGIPYFMLGCSLAADGSFNSLRPSDAYICVIELGHHWFR